MSKATAKTPLISIVVPAHNEARNLPQFVEELKPVMAKENYRFEVIVVDDGSTDNSELLLRGIQEKDDRFRVLQLVRNFGKEAAITAGLVESTGEAAIVIDADLQHPIALIPDFLRRWESGSDLVVGVRRKYGDEGLIKRVRSQLFYAILNSISETHVIPNSTDYRLLDRCVIDDFNRLTERNRITRGLVDWLGYTPDPIYFEARPRYSGTAVYSIFKLIQLAVNSFVSLSLFPLKLAGYLGIVITFTAGLLGVFIIIEQYLLQDPLNINSSPTALLAVMIVFLVGIILSCLGLIALYIANIHVEVINRPLYIKKRPRRRG